MNRRITAEIAPPQTDGRAGRLTRHARMALASPYLLLTSAPLLMAGNFIVGRALRGDVAPITLNFWRWTIALLILLPLSYPTLIRERAVLRSEWRRIAAIGASGIAAF